MKRLSDEILNKYIDGELADDERKKVFNQIEFSEEDHKRYSALLTVHNNLKQIKQYDVSAEFTSRFMAALVKKHKSKNQQKVFFITVSSVFVVIIFIVIGFMVSSIMAANSESSAIPLLSDFAKYISSAGEEISKGFKGNLSIIGSVLSFAFILTAYFFFDFHKNFRHRFDKLN